MSHIRFGRDGSQVYLYDTDDGTVCGMCYLTPLDDDGHKLRPDFATRDLDAMLAHLAEHRAAGHIVPSWLDADLRADWHEGNPCQHGSSVHTPCVVHQRRTGAHLHMCCKPGDGHRDHRCACGQPWSCDRYCISASHPAGS